MAHLIIKQPDGLFALYSTVSDGFINRGLTAEQVLEAEDVLRLERFCQRTRDKIAALEAQPETETLSEWEKYNGKP